MASNKRGDKKPNIPGWAGRYPFAPDQKKPKLLRREEAMTRLYGKSPHKVPTCLYVSTDKITSSEFSVPPGEYFEPCDIHGGAEVYYVSQGKATVLAPETGRVYTVPQGGVSYIPKKTWHQTYNFGEEKLVIITFFAPKMWYDKMGTEVDYQGEVHLYKGEPSGEISNFPLMPDEDIIWATPMNGQLGKYPVLGRLAEEKKLMFPILPEETLNLIHGDESRILVSFFISNEVIHTGIMTIPAFRESASEIHKGDEVCCVLKGAVSVIISDDMTQTKSISVSRFEIKAGERFLIPEGTMHRYYNHKEEIAKVLFSIAPGL